jgi:hypothetical protein
MCLLVWFVVSTDSWLLRGDEGGLRALEEGDEETSYVERDGIEDHDVAEPFIQFRWEDACGLLARAPVLDGLAYADK